VIPLRRNRNFLLLQAGQLLSSIGTASTSIAYPLLVLALTRSAILAGVVAFARGVPSALFLIPAGVLADRRDRKALMIAADVARVVAIGSLVVAVATHHAGVWFICVVAFVEGAGAALFSAARPGAVRAVVPESQLPDAAGAQTGQDGAVQIAGPPIGGALFALGRALPFVADVISYAFSSASLLAMRVPFQQPRDADRGRARDGLRFLWSRPFLRMTALLFGLGNFIGPGLVLAVIVIGRRQGVSAPVIGALTAVFGVCLLAGSFLTPLLRRTLTPRGVILLELWTALGCAAFLVRPSVFVLVAGMAPSILVIPSSNAIVHGYRIAETPDYLLGRSEAARLTLSLSIAPLGPLLAGALMARTSPRLTIGVFTVMALALALWGTLSPSLRRRRPSSSA